jgi:hypothetical protein
MELFFFALFAFFAVNLPACTSFANLLTAKSAKTAKGKTIGQSIGTLIITNRH